MNTKSAVTYANWLNVVRESYLRYLDEGNDREKVQGNRSGDWDEGEYVRTSKLASHCPKRDAAEHYGFIEKPKTSMKDLIRFDDAVRRAEQITEAITWGMNNQVTQWTSQTATEQRFKIDSIISPFYHLASTVDLLVQINEDWFPIEVKFTESNKWWGSTSGISVTNFMQVVGQMINIQQEHVCTHGFIYTTYSYDSQPPHKVWIVEYDEEDEGFYLLDVDGNHVRTDDENWPTVGNGKIFISQQQYAIELGTYKAFRTLGESKTALLANRSAYKDENPFNHWQCGRTKKPALNKNGTVKAGTGTITDICPLFKVCYKDRLEADGYVVKDGVDLPNELPLYLVDNEIRFAGATHDGRNN